MMIGQRADTDGIRSGKGFNRSVVGHNIPSLG